MTSMSISVKVILQYPLKDQYKLVYQLKDSITR